MFSCEEFLSEFGEYLEGSANPELRARIEEHLRECRSCQVIIDSTRKTIRIVTDSDTFDLPAGEIEPFVQQVMTRVRGLGK